MPKDFLKSNRLIILTGDAGPGVETIGHTSGRVD